MTKTYFKIIFSLTILTFIFTLNVQAQVDSTKAKTIKTHLLDTICKCVSQADISKIKTEKDAQVAITQCFMGDGLSLFMDYVTALGADMTNIADMQEMGKKIGLELASTCPAMLKIAVVMVENQNKIIDSSKAITAPAKK